MGNNEDEISLYQDLLKAEVEKFHHSQHKNFKDALLTKSDIGNIIKKYPNGSELFQNLLNKKMILSYGDKYRTAHMDLLAKLAFIRPYPYTEPYTLEFDIMLKEEPYPDFGSFTLDNLIRIIDDKLRKDGLSDDQRKLIKNIIEKLLNDLGLKGLSSFQGYIIDKILNSEYNYIPLVAPTATGKTIAFTIPAIVYLLESVLRGESPVNVIFVYPRKALAKDQIEKFIKYLDLINNELQQIDKSKKITIALEDGDTPTKSGIKDGDKYRGLKCPRCGGDLIYSNSKIVCNKCNRTYDFIVPTKDEIKASPPNVLITNLWILYRRLLNAKTVNNFKNVKYIVLDEVHAYDGVLYYHLRFILRLLFALKKLTNSSEIEKIVFSSATIPNHRKFISKLVCCKNDCIPTDVLTYEEYYENYKKYSSNLSKKRLILYEFLLPNINRGVETLTEDITEAVLAWLKEYKFKGILFADSISGVTNFYKYFMNTILGERKAREIRDHICYNSYDDEYYWPYLSAYRGACNNEKDLEKLAKDLKQAIDVHYSTLSLQQRLEIEKKFKNDPSKLMLFSTSTLELGIDIGDVAVIVQHKLPLSRESFIQRVGRAGRSENTYRIATGIVVLQATPFASLYMFNQDLRNQLISIAYNSLPNTLDSNNSQIILQYILSYLLLKRAIKNSRTCVDDGSRIEECEELIDELVNDIKSNTNKYLKELQDLLCIDLNSTKDDIMSLIDTISKSLHEESEESICKKTYEILDKSIGDVESDIEDIIDLLSEDDIRKIFEDNKFRLIRSTLHNTDTSVTNAKEILYNGPSDVKEVAKILESIQSYSSKLKEYKEQTLALKSKLESESEQDFQKYIKYSEVIDKLREFVDKLSKLIEDIQEFSKKTNRIIDDINAKKCIGNLSIFSRKLELNTIGNASPDIFSIIRMKTSNNIFTDLLMTPPAPSIESTIIESDENE